jgi:hypothetical protein
MCFNRFPTWFWFPLRFVPARPCWLTDELSPFWWFGGKKNVLLLL